MYQIPSLRIFNSNSKTITHISYLNLLKNSQYFIHKNISYQYVFHLSIQICYRDNKIYTILKRTKNLQLYLYKNILGIFVFIEIIKFILMIVFRMISYIYSHTQYLYF